MVIPIKVQKIKFKGNDYVLVNGAIVTPKAFTQGKCGFAHLGDDGIIRRYHTIIGNKNDIEFLGEITVDVNVLEFFDGILGDTWPEEILG